MNKIMTEIEINAPIEKVWAILTDFPSYPSWNPFIRNIAGEFRFGNRLTITICPPGDKEMKFKPKIINVDTYEFSWLGRLLFPWIFDGLHQFKLEKITDHKTRFIHNENFTGLISKMIFNNIGESAIAGFEKMNQALKDKSETD